MPADLGVFTESEWRSVAQVEEEWMAARHSQWLRRIPEWAQVRRASAQPMPTGRARLHGRVIARSFRRIKTFLKALASALTGLDFRSADDVFQGVATGKVGRRSRKNALRDLEQALFQSAWHGTPHTFDRFLLDKIGTGEGNQAYGWGLYFASKKEVAEHYRRNLAGADYLSRDGGITESSLWESIKDRIPGRSTTPTSSARTRARPVYKPADPAASCARGHMTATARTPISTSQTS